MKLMENKTSFHALSSMVGLFVSVVLVKHFSV